MPPAVKCPNCGALAKKGDGRFCSHCAGTFPDVARITPDEWTTHSERFDEAEASAWVATAQALPVPSVSIFAILLPLVFLGVWVALESLMLSHTEKWDVFRIGAMCILGLGVIGLLAMITKAIRFMRAPAERSIAVVIDERIKVSGGGDDSSATTHYYVTLEGRDGKREEFETTEGVAGLATAGDIGLAVMRMRTLVAFHRP